MKMWFPLLLIALLTASPAMAESPQTHADQEREAVEVILSHHHELPERKLFEEASSDARQIVTDIATGDAANPLHEQRALMALGYWADEESFEILSDALQSEDTPENTRRLIMPVLGEHFGQAPFEERTVDLLQEVLMGDDDPHTRISAGQALNEIDSEASLKVLRRALEVEEVDFVRDRLENFARTLR